MLVKTFIISKFYFFDACEHVIRIIISGKYISHSWLVMSNHPSGFLILTELPLFKSYVSRNWPLFSHRSGFVMLGFAMVFLGNSVLGNMNKEATSQESLGLAFWRVVIAAGIIALVMGPVNILAVSQLPHSMILSLTNHRATSSVTPAQISPPGKFALTAQSQVTKPMSTQLQRPILTVAPATGPSSWGRNAIPSLHTIPTVAPIQICRSQHPRNSTSQVPSTTTPAAQAVPAANTAKPVPGVSDMVREVLR